MAEHIALKKVLGNSDRQLGAHDVRDQVVDFVRRWSKRTEISVGRFIPCLCSVQGSSPNWRLWDSATIKSLKLSFALPGQETTITTVAELVWKNAWGNLGIAFVNTDPAFSQSVSKWMSAHPAAK